MGFLLASAGAAPAMAADPAKSPAAAAKVQTPDISAAQNANQAASRLNIVDHTKDLTEFSVIRAADLVNMHVRLINMVVTGPVSDRRITRLKPGPAAMVVSLAPQAMTEIVYPDSAGQSAFPVIDKAGNPATAGAGNVPADAKSGPIAQSTLAKYYLAGPSRLVFKAPTGVSVKFALADVLDACATWPLQLDPRATADAGLPPEILDFAAVAARLDVIATKQKAGLKKYGPASETLLNRTADIVVEAIAEAAFANKMLSDAAIDAIIDRELGAALKTRGAAVQTKIAQKLITMAARSVMAASAPTHALVPIDPDATDIEAPYRLHLSPLPTAGFAHARAAVNHGGKYTELWHTRMGTRAGDWALSDRPEPVRALWSDDFTAKNPLTGDWALSNLDRQDLVSLTTKSTAALARHMRLSALGASFDIEGTWNNSDLSDISAWKHVTSMGRDQFVRVIYEGFLYPFGHRASLIKVSERKFSRQSDGGRVAGLMQKYFLIVRDRVVSFPGAGQPFEGRSFPFTSVEITTRQTPDLAKPVPAFGTLGLNDASAFELFWPQMATGGDMQFDIVATDSAGRTCPFHLPLIFVAKSQNNNPSNLLKLNNYYNTLEHAKRKAILPNSLIRFSQGADAGGASGPQYESDYHAGNISFCSALATGGGKQDGGAAFYPAIESVTLEIASLKAMIGQTVTQSFDYHNDYLLNGFDAASNPTEMVFMPTPEFKVDKLHVDTTERFGGMIKPQFEPRGLSRKLGMISNTAAFDSKGKWEPSTGLPDDITLFGVIPLGKVLNSVAPSTESAGIPQLKTVTSGESVTTTYTLTQTKLKAFPSDAASPLFVPLDAGPDGNSAYPSRFSLTTTVTVARAGQPPDISVEADIENFKINMFGFIIVTFNRLTIKTHPGSKTEVDPVLDAKNGVMFGGPLEFINTLRDVIPMGGFADPPGLDITPQGITASYSLGLPNIPLGAITIQNVSLGAGFTLPFTGGGPCVRFNFAERHNTFNLTVGLFGGGGFVAISLDTGGVRELEAAIEFGAQICIDLGVASGGVYVKAGFYFMWQDSPEKIVLFQGYVELGGHLDVLGLITVSLVFHLDLTYEKVTESPGKGHTSLYGSATLTVEIDILFFSASQDISVERQFAGSDADPAFKTFMPFEDTWDEYCAAFAVPPVPITVPKGLTKIGG